MSNDQYIIVINRNNIIKRTTLNLNDLIKDAVKRLRRYKRILIKHNLLDDCPELTKFYDILDTLNVEDLKTNLDTLIKNTLELSKILARRTRWLCVINGQKIWAPNC